MRRPDGGDWAESEERANEHACIQAAMTDGYTMDQALDCDDGEFHCEGCPWRLE